MLFECFQCNSGYKKQFENDLINKFKNTYEFCNKDISKFILLIRKDIYPYFFSIRLIIQYIEDKLKQNKKHLQKQDSTFI